jgi:acylphosphatase
MAIERRVIRVFGRVQGVFYRQSARREAQQRGLTGFARNEPDGSVTLDVEGDPAAIEQFVEWCHHGPAGAVVERVEAESRDPAGRAGFQTL